MPNSVSITLQQNVEIFSPLGLKNLSPMGVNAGPFLAF